jgi:hypothetical protein
VDRVASGGPHRSERLHKEGPSDTGAPGIGLGVEGPDLALVAGGGVIAPVAEADETRDP